MAEDAVKVEEVLKGEADFSWVFGTRDENLRVLAQLSGVEVAARGNRIMLQGDGPSVEKARKFLRQLVSAKGRGLLFQEGDVRYAARAFFVDGQAVDDILEEIVSVAPGKKHIIPKSLNQRRYVRSMKTRDLVLGIGPAGTGKTFLAMAMAVSFLVQKKVSRIILTRPAVEAGEKLGFLPGDLYEKIHPYLRPLYDALYQMMDAEKVSRLVERGTIEIAPLAYMRGRTLNDSFIVLDEGQNTTSEQMKMFLTRLGFDSKAVVTGDITQVDLPAGRTSGLVEAKAVLAGVKGVETVLFSEKDVVRHELVQKIIRAYDRYHKHPDAVKAAPSRESGR